MKTKGFTLFFAMLVGSLALAVGLAIFDLTLRELQLSTVATQSQYAVYAADSGAECALYWDTKCSLGGCVGGSAFATSSNTNSGTFPPTSGITCNTFDVAANGTPPSPFQTQPTGWTAWVVQTTANAATTTFTFSFPGYGRCMTITVAKVGNPSQTTIISHGYNTCVAGPLQLERVLQVNY